MYMCVYENRHYNYTIYTYALRLIRTYRTIVYTYYIPYTYYSIPIGST